MARNHNYNPFLHFITTLSFATLLSSSNSHGKEQESVIGYGYRVGSVSVDTSSGNKLVADLHLINRTSIFGHDIVHLHLIARYENKRLIDDLGRFMS